VKVIGLGYAPGLLQSELEVGRVATFLEEAEIGLGEGYPGRAEEWVVLDGSCEQLDGIL